MKKLFIASAMILFFLGNNGSLTMAKVLPILEHGELMDSLALQYDEADCLPDLMAGPAGETVILPGSGITVAIPVLPAIKPCELTGAYLTGSPILPEIILSLTVSKDKIIRKDPSTPSDKGI